MKHIDTKKAMVIFIVIIILYVIYIEVITVAKMSDSKLIYKGNTYMRIYVERNNYDFDKLLGFVSEGFLPNLLPVPKGLRMQLYRTENGKNDFFVLARSSSPKLYCKVEKIKELQNDNFLSDDLQPQLENGTVTQIKINGGNTDINISEDVDFIIEQSNNEKTVSLLDDIKYNSPSEFVTDKKTDEIMIKYQDNIILVCTSLLKTEYLICIA